MRVNVNKYFIGIDIGGTKCGALMGEAVVINHNDLKIHAYRFLLRKNGIDRIDYKEMTAVTVNRQERKTE